MTIGTCHFLNLKSAINYYRDLSFTDKDVLAKIDAGEIAIYAPKIERGQLLSIVKGRYHIIEEDKQPTERLEQVAGEGWQINFLAYN